MAGADFDVEEFVKSLASQPEKTSAKAEKSSAHDGLLARISQRANFLEVPLSCVLHRQVNRITVSLTYCLVIDCYCDIRRQHN